jgi:hypothetical protein
MEQTLVADSVEPAATANGPLASTRHRSGNRPDRSAWEGRQSQGRAIVFSVSYVNPTRGVHRQSEGAVCSVFCVRMDARLHGKVSVGHCIQGGFPSGQGKGWFVSLSRSIVRLFVHVRKGRTVVVTHARWVNPVAYEVLAAYPTPCSRSCNGSVLHFIHSSGVWPFPRETRHAGRATPGRSVVCAGV